MLIAICDWLLSGPLIIGSFPAGLLDAALQSTLLIGVANVAILMMRRASGAQRHLVWLLAMSGLLVLPFLGIVDELPLALSLLRAVAVVCQKM